MPPELREFVIDAFRCGQNEKGSVDRCVGLKGKQGKEDPEEVNKRQYAVYVAVNECLAFGMSPDEAYERVAGLIESGVYGPLAIHFKGRRPLEKESIGKIYREVKQAERASRAEI